MRGFTKYALGLLALVAVAGLLMTAAAQNASTGTVFGVISDQSGAVLPNATVELRNSDTGVVRTATSNEAGRYSFPSVDPGTYTVKAAASGFSAAQANVTVSVGKSFTVNLALQVGQASQTVEVVAGATAELQTMDSTVGQTVGGETLSALPMPKRDVTYLLLLQPASTPLQGPGQGASLGGQVAGAQSDQNTILLDGANVTNGTSGNSDYFTNFTGGPEAPIPTPAESIEEFKVSTNNPNASFAGSAGSQVMLVTKRGTNTYHGSVYEFFQNSALDANTWDRNFRNQARPQRHDNRYGGAFGGPIPGLPQGAKTYFYTNYEGRQLSQINQITKLVPTDSLKKGILRFADNKGNIVAYDLKTATCAGGGKCDPLGLGISPVIASVWSKLPTGNDSTTGDGLNTLGFTAPVNLPVKENFGLVRLDHNLKGSWQVMASYRYFEQDAAVNKQIDIGGLLPGDTSGLPASAASIPRQPRFFVAGLTGQITPTLTNQFNFSYLRDFWQWNTAGASPQVSGTSAALQIGGETQNSSLVPMNVDTNSIRTRRWNGHNYNYRDDLSWLRGNHLVQFGGSWQRAAVGFFRNDGQVSALTQLVYQVTSGSGVSIASQYIPTICSTSVTTNCLPSAQQSNWKTLYASALGIVDSANVLGTRNAALGANPLGTPIDDDVRYDDYAFYVNDAWHIKPSLTLNFGLNWSYDTPPFETAGKQAMMVYAKDNSVVTPWEYLQQRIPAAQGGQVYNPVVGFAPIKSLHRKYPWDPVYTDFAPRVAAAWNPHFNGGWAAKLFGENKTVIRGGYAQLYDRLNGVQKVINGLQGVGFQQTLSCLAPNTTGVCKNTGGTDPTSAYRIGVNGSGSNIQVPPIQALTNIPLIPGTAAVAGANQNLVPQTFQMDPHYAPGRNHEFDLTVQRELGAGTVLEVGYIGHIAHNIYSPLQLDQVPFFMKFGGQTFAQAYDAVATALRGGTATNAVARQPFFEAILAGSSFCATKGADGAPSCTAGVASKFSSNFTNAQVFTLFNNMQGSFVTGPATAASNQVGNMFFWASRAHSNYNAGFVALHERNWKGLTLDANLTYAHSLDNTPGGIQDVDRTVSNSYDLSYNYGTSIFDRKFVLNVLGNYQLPFGKGTSFVDKVIGGWSVSPIWSWYSGLPLKITVGQSGGNELGAVSGPVTGAILTTGNNFGNSVQSGVNGDPSTNVATNGNPAKGGTGLNLFSNPVAVYQAFRYPLLSQDTRINVAGQIRGQARWNVDTSIAKKMRFTERFSSTLSVQMFNMFNHVQFNDPSVSLQSPQNFGVISTQLNTPRQIVLGLHLDF